MRQINLKILRSRITHELKNLPFEITKNGKVVAVVAKGLNLSDGKPSNKKKGLNNSDKKGTTSKKGVHKKTKWTNPLADTALAPKGT